AGRHRPLPVPARPRVRLDRGSHRSDLTARTAVRHKPKLRTAQAQTPYGRKPKGLTEQPKSLTAQTSGRVHIEVVAHAHSEWARSPARFPHAFPALGAVRPAPEGSRDAAGHGPGPSSA